MAISLLISSRYINNRLMVRRVFSSTSAFLIGSWFFIIVNALLTTLGFAKRWGNQLLVDDPSLYTISSAIVIIGIIFFTLGTIVSSKPKKTSTFSIKQLSKKEILVLLIIGILFFIPGNWAAYYSYNEVLSGSYWDRTTSIVSIANLIVPAALIGIVGVISSFKRNVPYLLFFGVILFLSISGLLLLWSRRPLLGLIFTLFMILFALKKGKPETKPLYYLFPFLIVGALFLSFYRSYVFFGLSTDDITITRVFGQYFESLWLESSAFGALMYSAGPALENDLLFGSSLVAAFVFFIPRSIFPDKPLSYELATLMNNDLPYNLPASFYGEALANFGWIGIPVLAFFLGYYLKKIDHIFYSKPRNIFELAVYILFAFNMFFMIRGSFSTVVSAVIVTCILPLLIYYFLRRIKI